jgi:hypothetical protein
MISDNDAQQLPVTAANFLWLAILALAGVGGSLLISCVTPFVALAVALAGTVKLTVALRAMIAVWLTNQFVGFAFLHFPRTSNTFLWGVAVGAAALLSTLVASIALKRAASWPTTTRIGLAFFFAYPIYEASLFVAALFLGGRETFSPAIVTQIGLVNLAWLAGLVALNELLLIACKRRFGAIPRFVKVS